MVILKMSIVIALPLRRNIFGIIFRPFQTMSSKLVSVRDNAIASVAPDSPSIVSLKKRKATYGTATDLNRTKNIPIYFSDSSNSSS